MAMGVVSLIIAYFLGGIPFGYYLVKWKTGTDVRQSGSGNIGATNVLRTQGRAMGIVTLLLDVAKGWLAVWITSVLSDGNAVWMSAAALVVLIGHAFPILLGFKGGKAVASAVGAYALLTPQPLIGAVAIFMLTVAVYRMISLGAIVAAAALPFGIWLILRPAWPVVALAGASAAFIIWRHQGNIERIRAGKENIFRWNKQ
jgi:acyl phosphate:glycerol-3-phosphate acyltransferase